MVNEWNTNTEFTVKVNGEVYTLEEDADPITFLKETAAQLGYGKAKISINGTEVSPTDEIKLKQDDVIVISAVNAAA